MGKNCITTTGGQLLPAYPLFVKDPFFSVWSPSDKLNESDTIFWTGDRRRIFGVVNCDGQSYSFLGLVDGAKKLEQTSVTLTAFSTDYTFTCDSFDLKVSFISPLPPTNLTLLSCPVCYLTHEITPKKKIGSIKVGLFLHEENCYDKIKFPIHGGTHYLPQGETSWFGMKKQLFMSHSADRCAVEWGYWYMTGNTAMPMTCRGLRRFIKNGSLDYDWIEAPTRWDDYDEKYLSALNCYENIDGAVSGMITLAFDDMVSIDYYGDWRKGYYFNEGKNIFDAIADARENFDSIMAELDAFNEDLYKRAQKYGEDYLLILYAGLRQAVGAHKLVKNKDGEVLWLSKECGSNGCIATVDVSYPSMPLFLLYNTELVKGMLRPIFAFNDMPVWEYDFAPHDAGTYPHCLGQVYGARGVRNANCKEEIDLKNRKYGFFQPDIPYIFPPIYTFPKGSNVYRDEGQMPVEECGNMLIMVAATLIADGDKTIAKKNFKSLTKWVKYLVKYGLKPGNQLCTDDFAGHLDKNINLSVKAIVGIRAFAYICEQLNKDSLAVKYKDIAYNYASEWKKMCVKEGKQIPLVFDGDDSQFSLKYNMAFDVLFGTGLFDQKTRETEIDYYLKVAEKYGTPLDSRDVYTKSDWLVWSATLTGDIEKRKKMIAPLAKFLRECTPRYPFTDHYDTDTATVHANVEPNGRRWEMVNRTVQGGLFILLLDDSGVMKIN